MADSWMYDAFPLKRADETTRADDYQYVIQSLDAALRHTFGFPTGVPISPPFSINEDGDVEILETLRIGGDVAIGEIVDEIPTSAGEDDDSSLANVAAIREFTAAYIDDYLTTQDLFVLKTGDSMSGPLAANAGITAAEDLDITNAVFKNNPKLDIGMALQSYGGIDLIQFDSAVVVGDSTESLQLTGAGGRPLYKGQNVALVSDIVGTIPGMDYVPEAGGTFDGQVTFDAGLLIAYGNSIDLEWNVGANFFSLVQVGDDALGDVLFGSGDDTFEFDGDVLATAFDLDIGTRENVLYFSGGEIKVGDVSVDIDLLGLSARPLYNGVTLALSSDVAGTFVEGSGINFNDLGGGVNEIEIEPGGINISHMPAGGANGEYSRISSGGLLVWSSLDIVAGTGMVVAEDGPTKQITVSINDLGVDTAQLAAEAVTQAKLADDTVGYDQLDAIRTVPDDQVGLYSLIVDADGAGNGTLEWQKGGAAGVLGTIETLADNDDNSTEIYEEALAGADGPYVITRVEFTDLVAPKGGTIMILIDGQEVLEEVLTDAAEILIGNTEDAMHDFPFFAKTSFEVKHKRTGGAGSVNCSVAAIRMA